MSAKAFSGSRLNKYSIVYILGILFVISGCEKNTNPSLGASEKITLFDALKVSEENLGTPSDSAVAACADVHYSYSGHEGPDQWANICEGWTACGVGKSQSPVDISKPVNDPSLKPLQFKWATTNTNIVNNGHTIQFNIDPGSKLTANGKTYDLLQFHYHHVSEHTINGAYSPLEVHYVHKAADGKLAVVGVMFKEGAPNELFNMFLSQLPQPMTTFSSSVAIDLKSLLPKNQRYYQYMGSLTTPSCAESVTWHVLTSAVTASKEQLEAFKHILHHNVRPIQPLNGRVVRLSMDVVPG